MSSEKLIADAFEAFLGEHDTTLTPAAFLHWMQENAPYVVDRTGADEILSVAAQYCGQGLTSNFMTGTPSDEAT